MAAQIVKQVMPVIRSRCIEQATMSAVNGKPGLLASQQRADAREGQTEIVQRLTVTRMHDVDCLRRFSNDRETKLTRSRGRNGRKSRQLLAPQIIFVRTSCFTQP